MSDIGLDFLFFIQHSVMVRQRFRHWLTNLIAPVFHSAIFAITSGITLIAVVVFWQESSSIMFELHGVLKWGLRSFILVAIVGFIWSNRALKGFDPFGIRQLLRYMHDKPDRQTPFSIRGPYRYVRHPLYFCSLLMIWSYPTWTTDRLLFNLMWTVWIILGTILEERELIAFFGESYRQYQRKVPMLIPSWKAFKGK